MGKHNCSHERSLSTQKQRLMPLKLKSSALMILIQLKVIKCKKSWMSMYASADIYDMVSKCNHLTNNERSNLKKLLENFETLFDAGTLGTWDTYPIDLKLKNPNAKPYHVRPYPVLQS
jgi:hypothetical protein